MKSRANQRWLRSPPSPLPSPPGENLRLDWSSDIPQNEESPKRCPLSPGERVRVRASVKHFTFRRTNA